MVSTAELGTKAPITWCAGCGDFGILNALKKTISDLNLPPEKVAVFSGIGCGADTPEWINVYGFHTLHGRPVPVASGAKLANHDLTVIAVSGDGDGYGIGMGHLIHAMRRNIDMTYLVYDNGLYSLTTGQASPTAEKGTATKSTPNGVIETPVNPMVLAIAGGCTFVARGFAGDLIHLSGLIAEAIKHRGFALVDILQPCVTFNKINTYQYYLKRVYKLGSKYDPTDKKKAFEKAEEWGDRIPIGVLYKEERSTYADDLPQISKTPLVKQSISKISVAELMKELE
ncbi:MAG: 2-oxoacid:ferredoxin oxidoreductase subunit beta [Candidatus Micrarchaeota archaeon]